MRAHVCSNVSGGGACINVWSCRACVRACVLIECAVCVCVCVAGRVFVPSEGACVRVCVLAFVRGSIYGTSSTKPSYCTSHSEDIDIILKEKNTYHQCHDMVATFHCKILTFVAGYSLRIC